MLTHEVKLKIKKSIPEFDIFGLLDLLVHVGLDLEYVAFRGYRGNESQPRLIKDIEFESDGRVVIHFYYGLQGANSCLPSYLFQMADSGVIKELHFEQFVGFLDEVLLRTWLKTMYPERFQLSYMFRESRKTWLSAMGKFASISRISWLFQLVYPELQIRVEKTEFENRMETRAAVIGKSKIGIEMILGNQFPIMDYLYSVTLIAEGEYFRYGKPWHGEVHRRLEKRVIPFLAPLSLNMLIKLVILDSDSWITLSRAQNFLGFERLKSDDLSEKTVLIHRGPIDTYRAGVSFD